MKLKSFGCSFIFGSELSDDGRNGLYATGSRLTWPALLAKEYGYEYETYSRPGSGNLQIMERVLNQVSNIEPALYVIGWTWIDRFDYIDPVNAPWPGTSWATLMPIETSAVAKTYYKNLHSEYRDKLTSLVAIKSTIDALKKRNLPFVMTYMDDLMFDNRWNSTSATNDLQEYIKPYMTQFEGMNFLDWSKKNRYPIGTAAHPLEEAHKAAAQYILELGVHKV
jgi:hypothetical protein